MNTSVTKISDVPSRPTERIETYHIEQISVPCHQLLGLIRLSDVVMTGRYVRVATDTKG